MPQDGKKVFRKNSWDRALHWPGGTCRAECLTGRAGPDILGPRRPAQCTVVYVLIYAISLKKQVAADRVTKARNMYHYTR